MLRRLSLFAGWLAWTAVILLVTLPWRDLQDHTHWAKVQWIPFVTPPIRLRDLVGNVFLYLPFGLLARQALTPRIGFTGVALIAASLSFTAETAQLFSHRRFPSSTDLVCNLAGTWLGFMLTQYPFRRARPALVQELS